MNHLFNKVLEKMKVKFPGTVMDEKEDDDWAAKMELCHKQEGWKVSVYFAKKERNFAAEAVLYGKNRDIGHGQLVYVHEYAIQALIQVVQEEDFECMIATTQDWYSSPSYVFPHGASAKHIHKLNQLLHQHLKVHCRFSGTSLVGLYTYYGLVPNFDDRSIHVTSNDKVIDIIHDESDVDRFVSHQQATKNELGEMEDSMVKYAQQLDPTAYFTSKNKQGSYSYLYLLGQKIPFSIIDIGGRGIPKYKLKFNQYSNVAKTKDQIEIKAKERIQNHYKKNRLKAVLSRDINMIERNLFTMIGKQVIEYNFKTKYQSHIPYENFRKLLSVATEKQIVKAGDDDNEWFNKYMKENKMRYKLKSSYRLEEYRLFITASAYFVFEESQIKQIS